MNSQKANVYSAMNIKVVELVKNTVYGGIVIVEVVKTKIFS